jgi:hypothetical protein
VDNRRTATHLAGTEKVDAQAHIGLNNDGAVDGSAVVKGIANPVHHKEGADTVGAERQAAHVD